LGIVSRAFRNLSRRKIRALLVVIALGFSMAIMIAIPAGIAANQSATQNLTNNLSGTILQTEASINQTLTQIDCSLTPSAPSGFGFSRGNFSAPPGGNFPDIPPGDFTPGQFGGGPGGGVPGEFGGGAFGIGGSEPMNETYYADVANVSGVAAVANILQVSEGHNITVTTPFGINFTRLVADYVIKGVPLTSIVNDYPILPTNITDGRSLQAGDTGVVLLSENNSAYFNVGVGDTVNILNQDFLVVGVYGSSGVSDRTTLYMNLFDAQTLTNNTGYITSLEVFAESSDVVSSVASDIGILHSELDVTTTQERLDQLEQAQANYATQLENAQATLNQTQSQAFQEIAIAVVATSLIVLFVMLYTVRERTKEIGTLKAIGFSNRAVMSQFLLEGILLSLLAGVVGIVIGSVAAPFLSSVLLPSVNLFGSGAGSFRGTVTSTSTSSIVVSPELMLIGFGVSIALGALGSLYPAWRASRTRPAEAMRYE
jgi:putative ABC transport system permease protein